MDANMERPELRTFETQPHKLILADRGLYIADCLTIPLAYMLAGSPGRLPPLAGFEEWSDVVRSALVWVGCADPIETVATATTPDRNRPPRCSLPGRRDRPPTHRLSCSKWRSNAILPLPISSALICLLPCNQSPKTGAVAWT
jgi:hypothetical protein